MKNKQTSLKKIGVICLCLTQFVLMLLSLWLFYGGMFAYGTFYNLEDLWLAIPLTSLPCWMLFLMNLFLEKKMGLRKYCKITKKVSVALFFICLALFVVTSSWWGIFNFILPFAFLGLITPRLSYLVWQKTKPNHLPWILTFLGCLVVSTGLFTLLHLKMNLL